MLLFLGLAAAAGCLLFFLNPLTRLLAVAGLGLGGLIFGAWRLRR